MAVLVMAEVAILAMLLRPTVSSALLDRDGSSPLHDRPALKKIHLPGTPRAEDLMTILESVSPQPTNARATHTSQRNRRNTETNGGQRVVSGYTLATFAEDEEKRISYSRAGGNFVRTCLFFNTKQRLPSTARIHYAVLEVKINCTTPLGSGGRAFGSDDDPIVAQDLDTNGGSLSSMSQTTGLDCSQPNSDWVRMEVTMFVRPWTRRDRQGSICLVTRGHQRVHLPMEAGSQSTAYVTVIYEQESLALSRTCTSTNPVPISSRGAEAETCCRMPYFVDFKQTALRDQIVFPSGYQAYTCGGWCPRRPDSEQAGPRRAGVGVTEEIHDWFSGIHRQCRPKSYAPVIVMLRGQSSFIQIYSMSNSTVLACGCAP